MLKRRWQEEDDGGKWGVCVDKVSCREEWKPGKDLEAAVAHGSAH